ncbi:SCP2 sterol-binding domain-containing protein [Hypericibacter sp.]|uniref:SCP2 sterol-binding domain-containing protein n=1 Tax=Hypericibacter sp. TaxID=2705401 RepID=UPI003D6D3677
MSEIEDLTQILNEKVKFLPPLGYKLKIELDEGGLVIWDGTGSAPVITNEDGSADTTLRMTSNNAKALMEGRLDPTLAYMTGKLKVEGKLGVAMKLAAMLGD